MRKTLAHYAIGIFRKRLWRMLALVFLNLICATMLDAQVVKVRDFWFGPKQHRNVLFSRVVAPNNDVLSLVAMMQAHGNCTESAIGLLKLRL